MNRDIPLFEPYSTETARIRARLTCIAVAVLINAAMLAVACWKIDRAIGWMLKAGGAQ